MAHTNFFEITKHGGTEFIVRVSLYGKLLQIVIQQGKWEKSGTCFINQEKADLIIKDFFTNYLGLPYSKEPLKYIESITNLKFD